MCVTVQVRSEALSIRKPDPEDASLLVSSPIDVATMISDGLLKECGLEAGAETDIYVEFAAQVDDGEASCLAIAKTRGWLVATDDRKARRNMKGTAPYGSSPSISQPANSGGRARY